MVSFISRVSLAWATSTLVSLRGVSLIFHEHPSHFRLGLSPGAVHPTEVSFPVLCRVTFLVILLHMFEKKRVKYIYYIL